jgi:beta-lactamase regulating signal transducer with metallopeptidase domain
MKSRTAWETGICCATGVVLVAIVAGDDNHNSWMVVWMVVALMIALTGFAAFRYLTSRNRQRLELTGNEQYRQLTDEYRRLSDLAITAQEHTDLKLGEVSAQLDYLRSQVDSLQKILSEVE